MELNYINFVISPAMKADFIAACDGAVTTIPYACNLEFIKKKHRRKLGPKRIGLANLMLTAAKTHQASLPTEYNLQGFVNTIDNIMAINEMLTYVMSHVVEPLNTAKAHLHLQGMQHTDYVHGLLKIERRKGSTGVIEVLNEIQDFTKHSTTRLTTVKANIAAGMASTFDKVAGGSMFKNIGNTVLEVHKGKAETMKGIKVMPDTGIKLPNGYKQIYVKNLSADADGKFIVKIRMEI